MTIRFPSLFSDLRARCFDPVDAAGLAVLRMMMGAVMTWQAWRYSQGDHLDVYWSTEGFRYYYWPMEFVRSWPETWLQAELLLAALLGVLVMVGFQYRLSAFLLTLVHTHLFLLDRSVYLNHLYLACLVCAVLTFLPCHRCWSLDTWLRPGIRRDVVPRGALWAARAQLALPMFFAGIVKLKVDWLTSAEPLGLWLAYYPFEFLDASNFLNSRLVLFVMVYGAVLIDLLFPFYAGWRRTRFPGLLLVSIFHLLNGYWFNISIFPSMMLLVSLVFLPPGWPRRVLAVLQEGLRGCPSWGLLALLLGFTAGALLRGLLLPGTREFPEWTAAGVALAVLVFHAGEPLGLSFRVPARVALAPSLFPAGLGPGLRVPSWTVWVAALWFLVQVVVPLRHHAMPGDVAWTGEGDEFAWRMMARSRDSWALTVWVSGPGQESWEPFEVRAVLSGRMAFKLGRSPVMLVQFARWLDDESAWGRGRDLRVRADMLVSLNGRPPARIIDPRVDLTTVRYPWWGHADWILLYPERP